MSPYQTQTQYENAREHRALTVEEFEREMNLPPFSVYPHAREARTPAKLGFFMYSPATRAETLAEENREIVCLLRLGIDREELARIYHRRGRTLPTP